jgi:hypothetical protein
VEEELITIGGKETGTLVGHMRMPITVTRLAVVIFKAK